jgi:predicted house-cleaning noncanonical NTP pyrophosphatase (MazG superfamily)
MRITYNKLVRDRIPEIIRADGKRCQVSIMSEEEYRLALAEKLVEEATEALAAARASDEAGLMKELADIYEVVDGLMASHGLEREAVLDLQRRRRQERGGFAKRLRLVWVE